MLPRSQLAKLPYPEVVLWNRDLARDEECSKIAVNKKNTVNYDKVGADGR